LPHNDQRPRPSRIQIMGRASRGRKKNIDIGINPPELFSRDMSLPGSSSEARAWQHTPIQSGDVCNAFRNTELPSGGVRVKCKNPLASIPEQGVYLEPEQDHASHPKHVTYAYCVSLELELKLLYPKRIPAAPNAMCVFGSKCNQTYSVPAHAVHHSGTIISSDIRCLCCHCDMEHFLYCSICGGPYCNSVCQLADWTAHQHICRPRSYVAKNVTMVMCTIN
jgi:hypothetical protein